MNLLDKIVDAYIAALRPQTLAEVAKNHWRSEGVSGEGFALSYYATRAMVTGHRRSSYHYLEGARIFFEKELRS